MHSSKGDSFSEVMEQKRWKQSSQVQTETLILCFDRCTPSKCTDLLGEWAVVVSYLARCPKHYMRHCITRRPWHFLSDCNWKVIFSLLHCLLSLVGAAKHSARHGSTSEVQTVKRPAVVENWVKKKKSIQYLSTSPESERGWGCCCIAVKCFGYSVTMET